MLKEEIYKKYEVVIGLEIHAQLQTRSKAYSSDSTAFGAAPNSNVSAVSLGHPGTLPRFNEKTLEFGVRLGLACNSSIRHEKDRKSTRLNSSHVRISYAVFCLKKKKK